MDPNYDRFPCSEGSFSERVQNHLIEYRFRYLGAAAAVGAAFGIVVGHKIARNPAWSFTLINYKPTIIKPGGHQLPKTVQYGRDIVDLASRNGLKESTVADLLRNGWRYMEKVNGPSDSTRTLISPHPIVNSVLNG